MDSEDKNALEPINAQMQSGNKNQNQAMQRYLRYLKSDSQPLTEEEVMFYKTRNKIWNKTIAYPPFED